MISTPILLLLLVVTTCSALKLQSPITSIRSLDDIHINCERDITEFCSNDKSSLETNAGTDKLTDPTYPRMTADYDQIILDMSEETKEDEQIRLAIAHRIAGIRARAKDDNRFLNYGSNTDTCLWNAFHAKQVSRQCASALTYINDTIDFYPIVRDYELKVHVGISFIPCKALYFFSMLFIFYIIFMRGSNRKVDENERNEAHGDEDDSEQYHYQTMAESKEECLIAVPLQQMQIV